jgi:hypothetical protein
LCLEAGVHPAGQVFQPLARIGFVDNLTASVIVGSHSSEGSETMDPLATLAVELKPELKALIESDNNKVFESMVVAAVRDITRTTDVTAAKQTLATDPQVKKLLEDRLTGLADVQSRMQGTGREAARLKAYGWINPLLSMVITVGFLALVFILLFKEKPAADTSQVFNIALGALATAFATVIGFHFGSSVGSKEKDTIIADRAVQDEARIAATPAKI